ncbi:metallophosphoesterase [Dorea sp. ICN-14282]|uniref:metallophosphoesterase n=1 Tax=Dorea sp. ICN-14282 TaxID=3134654 RepID=UPI0030BC0727
MNDFTILHLSDFHINKSGEKLPLLLDNLLLDIEQEMRVVNNIIIVTGDLVHKGNYQSKESVLTFFKKRNEKI